MLTTAYFVNALKTIDLNLMHQVLNPHVDVDMYTWLKTTRTLHKPLKKITATAHQMLAPSVRAHGFTLDSNLGGGSVRLIHPGTTQWVAINAGENTIDTNTTELKPVALDWLATQDKQALAIYGRLFIINYQFRPTNPKQISDKLRHVFYRDLREIEVFLTLDPALWEITRTIASITYQTDITADQVRELIHLAAT